MARGLLAVLVLALALVGFGAVPADAHAAVVSTTPAAGAALDTAPATVSVRFSEAVQATSDAIRVLDAHGARVDQGGAATEPGHSDTVAVAVRSGLAQGTYTVAWHVTSADSHPVHGAFAFAVGHTGAVVAPLADADRGATSEVTTLVHLARGFGYAGLALLVGAIGIGVLLDGGVGRAGVARQAHAGALILTVSAAVDLLAQGPYAAGAGLGSLFDPTLLHDTLSGRTGVAEAVRVVLAAVLTLALGAGVVPGVRGPAQPMLELSEAPDAVKAPESSAVPELTTTPELSGADGTVPEGPLPEAREAAEVPDAPEAADAPDVPGAAEQAEPAEDSAAEAPADPAEVPAADAVEAHGTVTADDPVLTAPEAAAVSAAADAPAAEVAEAPADPADPAEAPAATGTDAAAPGTGQEAGSAAGARTALTWARVAPYAPFPMLVALAATFSATSHAATGRHAPVAFVMDLLHLMAMGLWLGGLVALATLCTNRAVAADPGTPAAFTTAVRRFSPLAAWCVGILVVTGTLQAIRLLGSVEDMVTTGWGRYLTVKLAVILVLLALARTARGWTHRYAPVRRRTERGDQAEHGEHADQAVDQVERVDQAERSERSEGAAEAEGDGRTVDSGSGTGSGTGLVGRPAASPLRTMRRTLATEACVGVVVLALSTMLASSAPPADRAAGTAAAGSAPAAASATGSASTPAAPAHLHAAYDTGDPGGSGTAVAVVTPQPDGSVAIDLTLTSAGGAPAQPAEFTAAMSLPSLSIGPLPLDLEQSGPGHWEATTTPTPKGKWQLALTIRTSDVDETTVTFPATLI